MVARETKWEAELRAWVTPFLDRLGHKARRRMLPLYLSGLIGPGDRKSIQPMAARVDPRHVRARHQSLRRECPLG